MRRILELSVLILIFVTPFLHGSIIFGQGGPQILGGYDHEIIIQRIVDGLNRPSGMEFVEGGDILVIERDSAQVKLIRNFDIKKYPIADLNLGGSIREAGHGLGITSLEIDDEKRLVFVSYIKNSSANAVNAGSNRIQILQYEWNSTDLSLSTYAISNPILDFYIDPNSIITEGDILIGPDELLYSVVGPPVSASDLNISQLDTSSGILILSDCILTSKTATVLRTTLAKESFGNDINQMKVYASGLPNSLNLVFDPVTNLLWGVGYNANMTQGEVFVLNPEGNDELSNSGFEDCNIEPKYIFGHSTELTGLTFIDNSGNFLGENRDTLFVSDKKGNIYTFYLDEKRERIVDYQKFSTGFGPISDMKIGPDGALYVLASSKANSANVDGSPPQENSGSIFRIAKDRLSLPFYESVISYADQISLIGISTVVATLMIIVSRFNKRKRLSR